MIKACQDMLNAIIRSGDFAVSGKITISAILQATSTATQQASNIFDYPFHSPS